MLDRLERANALVTRRGRRGTWYSYHTLLRGFLLAELRRRDVDAARVLHGVAAAWFAEADMPGPALEQAAAAADDETLLAFLRRFSLRLLLSGAGGVVQRVLADASPTVLASADTALIGAVDALERGELLAAKRTLRRLARADVDGDGWRVGMRDAALLYQARLDGDTDALSDDRYRDGSPAGAGLRTVDADAEQDVELLLLANRGALRMRPDTTSRRGPTWRPRSTWRCGADTTSSRCTA